MVGEKEHGASDTEAELTADRTSMSSSQKRLPASSSSPLPPRLREQLAKNPEQFDFFSIMRAFERSASSKPRIGYSKLAEQDIVTLSQNPFMSFPDRNVSGYEEKASGIPDVATHFLGFFGPQGALSLEQTAEAFQWALRGDDAFVKFVNLFSNRFLQLFFRAWANARPLVQQDRPDDDHFRNYVASFAGLGTPALQNRDSVNDLTKLAFVGLIGSRIKSAKRLQSFLHGVFGVEVEVKEHVGSKLIFEKDDAASLGMRGSSLGQDCFLGAAVYSINDKIRVSIKTESLEQYQSFLPGGDLSVALADLLFFYLGHQIECEVELALRADKAPPVQLGASGQLGWSSWLPEKSDKAQEGLYVRDAHYNPMEYRAREHVA